MLYDAIIVGAGPAGIFTALEMIRKNKTLKILMLEKGRRMEKRLCPKRESGICAGCVPCNITTGFSGAGAYSDGKLSLSPEIGGDLAEVIGFEALEKLIHYVDQIYLSYGADRHVYGSEEHAQVIESLRKRAIESNLKLVDSPIRHLGTEKSYEIYSLIEKYLVESGVNIEFNQKVESLMTENGRITGVKCGQQEYFGHRVALCVGREGADWLTGICRNNQIDTEAGVVDLGVRVEVRNEILKEVNETIYESKLVYYTPTFDDKVRTFCQNPSGIVATEIYDDHLAVVNGHSYKSKEYGSQNTNFALLVSNRFTEPFKDPIQYGKAIATLGNLLAGNRIIVQRFGDLKRGRRTTASRLSRNNIRPTLRDAVPGDLSLVLPYRILLDIKEMIIALNHLFPGMASDETLLYGVEVKFYSNKIKVNQRFETNLSGLYVGGDGGGMTRGLMQASVNGVLLGREILTSLS